MVSVCIKTFSVLWGWVEEAGPFLRRQAAGMKAATPGWVGGWVSCLSS